MEITITTTAQEIMDRGAWEEFCELRGINPWCVSEGLMDPDEQFTLSPREMGIIGLDWTKIKVPF